jgi:hypothetical protein
MSAADRYTRFTADQLDAASAWLCDQGATPWSKRFKIEGDAILGDLRGMPPVVRQMLVDYFEAIQLMTPEQVRQLVAADVGGRVSLVDQVLTEAGR